MRQRFWFILGVTLCAAAGLAPQAARAQEPTVIACFSDYCLSPHWSLPRYGRANGLARIGD